MAYEDVLRSLRIKSHIDVQGTSTASTFAYNVDIAGDLSVDGDFTFGDAAADSLTVNGAATFNADVTFTLGSTEAFTLTCTDISAPLVMTNTITTATKTGGRALFTTSCNVAAGSYINAIKGHMEFGDTGGSTSGLASAICAELTMPDQSVPSGQYYPLEIEMIDSSSTGTNGTLGSGCGFIYARISGTTTDFDDEAGLMWINGVAAGAGHLLSAGSQTLRIFVTSSMTAKYMLLSDTENCLVMSSTAAYLIDLNSATGSTADIRLQNGATITNTTDVLTITEPTLTFAGSTAINLDGPTTVTGILTIDTASSPADGIKINATTPTDGLEISSVCGTHAINISTGQTAAGITIASTCGTYGLNIVGACSTAGIALGGASAIGLSIAGSCTDSAIKLTGTSNLTGIQYNVDQTTQIGATVTGMKMILERTADVLIGTSNVIGAEIIIKQGGTGYSTAYAPSIKGFRVAIGGDNAIATNVWGIISETQTNGVVRSLLALNANTGATVGTAMAELNSFCDVPSAIHIGAGASASVITNGVYYSDNTGTGEITNLITVENCSNTTNFLKITHVNGCIEADATGDTWTHRLAVDVGGATRYIKLSSA